MSQIDKLAYDIEGYINDFESGVTGKEETIKALCYYVGERAKTAVESEREMIIQEGIALDCPDCNGTGKEICSNPDHGLIDCLGSVRLMGHANGCPCCGNDELHRIKNSTCGRCDGTGKINLFIKEEENK